MIIHSNIWIYTFGEHRHIRCTLYRHQQISIRAEKAFRKYSMVNVAYEIDVTKVAVNLRMTDLFNKQNVDNRPLRFTKCQSCKAIRTTCFSCLATSMTWMTNFYTLTNILFLSYILTNIHINISWHTERKTEWNWDEINKSQQIVYCTVRRKLDTCFVLTIWHVCYFSLPVFPWIVSNGGCSLLTFGVFD